MFCKSPTQTQNASDSEKKQKLPLEDNSPRHKIQTNLINSISPSGGSPLLHTGDSRTKVVQILRELTLKADLPAPHIPETVKQDLQEAERVLSNPAANDEELQKIIISLETSRSILIDHFAAMAGKLRDIPGRLSPAFQNKENIEKLSVAYHIDFFKEPSTWKADVIQGLIAYLSQGECVIQFTKETESAVRNSWDALRKKFDWGRKEGLKAIYLTGSDFHNYGKAVCIIETDKGNKTVFKPRDMTPEAVVSDQEQSFFHDFNKIISGNVPLPTQSFLLEASGFGYTEFIDPSKKSLFSRRRPPCPFPILSPAQEDFHFEQLGQIAVFSKLLGIVDLHIDNIMTTNQGFSFMIDNEVAFQPDFIADLKDWTGNSLALCIKMIINVENPEKFPANFYLREAEIPLLSKYRLDPEGIYFLQQAVGKRRKAEMDDFNSNCWSALRRGIAAGINKLQKVGLQRFQIMLNHYLTSIGRVRFVPVATQKWRTNLGNYLNGTSAGRASQIQASVDAVVAGVAKHQGSMSMPREILGQLICEDFDRMDIPLFQLDPNSYQIFYQNRVLAAMNLTENLQTVMKKTFTALSGSDPEKMALEIAKQYFDQEINIF